jgi:hypothetical protein
MLNRIIRWFDKSDQILLARYQDDKYLRKMEASRIATLAWTIFISVLFVTNIILDVLFRLLDPAPILLLLVIVLSFSSYMNADFAIKITKLHRQIDSEYKRTTEQQP